MALLRIPQGDTVVSYDSYPEAQRAVDKLADAEFPVKRVAIVGTGLTSVEYITGKLSYGRAAGSGAFSGAWLGLIFGFLFTLVEPQVDVVVFGAAVLIGAALGMMFTMFTYAMGKKRRNFSSTAQIVAQSYALVVEPDLANKARNILGVEPPAL